jgi:hypothetical protein
MVARKAYYPCMQGGRDCVGSFRVHQDTFVNVFDSERSLYCVEPALCDGGQRGWQGLQMVVLTRGWT